MLAGILATASTQRTVGTGAVLLAAYALGLALPFLLLTRSVIAGNRRPARWLTRRGRTVERVGGVLLIGMGLAIATGGWTVLMSGLLSLYARLGLPI